MKLQANNGVYLGEISWEEGRLYFESDTKMTIYMLEQTLIHMRRLSK